MSIAYPQVYKDSKNRVFVSFYINNTRYRLYNGKRIGSNISPNTFPMNQRYSIGNLLAAEVYKYISTGGEIKPLHLSKKNTIRLSNTQTAYLEKVIDNINTKLKPLTSFILPGGDKISSLYHLARTICRRCEISIVKLSEKIKINTEILKYINRLSDLLFVLARQTNKNEILWKPLKNK